MDGMTDPGGNLRNLLDQASMGELPVQVVRLVLLTKARAFAQAELGESFAIDRRPAAPEAVAAAKAALTTEAPIPLLSEAAWQAAFDLIPSRDQRGVFGSFRKRLKGASREVMIPLLRASLLRQPIGADVLFRGAPLIVPVTMSLLVDEDVDPEVKRRSLVTVAMRHNAKDLPLEARGALWLTVWDQPALALDVFVWSLLGYRGEPAAVGGAMLALTPSLDDLAPREATTRALLGILNRTDPWLTANWDAIEQTAEDKGPIGPRVWAGALAFVADSALLWGGASSVIETLRGLLRDAAPSNRLPIAVALGRLGDETGSPVLLEALSEDQAENTTTIEALAALGPKAVAAAPVLEKLLDGPSLYSRWRRVNLLVALSNVCPEDPTWSDQLARELTSEELLSWMRNSQEQFVEGLITADELAQHWVRPTVSALRTWARAATPSTTIRDAATQVRATLNPEVPFAEHVALASLVPALEALRA